MSQEDPSKAEKIDDQVLEGAFRRRFLAGGAVAAVGAIAAVITPKEAGAAITDANGNQVLPLTYHPNENLAKAIVAAWSKPAVRDKLLTYPKLTKELDWSSHKSVSTEYDRVQNSLAAFGIFVDMPVVLTCEQYGWGYLKSNDEVIFVLPDAPRYARANNKYTMATARVAMIYCPFGM